MTAWGSSGNRAGGALTLAGTLEAAEAAAPVESLDVVARMLKERLGAASVSFLITDFNGSSVVRLTACWNATPGAWTWRT
ncbi:hypothetical protein [Streptomyces sp. NPDC007905]|uniref:hypothetical protein n=1 Tax=Streptomyces sp. NPDC007905 TaxID=3364788 RepID=UPI0036EEC40A